MERATYRIIDANFNRAREAIRVIEEYCRFALNSTWLSRRAKELRHRISRAVSQFDTGRLLSSRDTLNDVGIGETVQHQLMRSDLKECFTAGCKRLTEALRTLAEVIQTQDKYLAKVIEKLRFDAYDLERDIVLFSEPAEKFGKVTLYIVITSDLPAEIISLTYMCAAGADGVHLGQNDLPVNCARRLQLAPLIIGKSTHSVSQLRSTCDEHPAYVGLGPVFATETKSEAEPVGLEYVRQAKKILFDTGVAHVAIGGITPDNIEQVVNAGAERIAVCSAVTKASNPKAACQALKSKIIALRDVSNP